MGCYGYQQARTATLDNLARDGVAFRTVVVSSPLTFPSHCSILTGTSPPVHGVRDNVGYRFSGRPPTLAQLLSSQHYATGAFVGAYLLDKRRGLGEGFETYASPFRGGRLENSLVNNLQSAQRRAEEVIADALAWLRTIQGSPFFVWVHLFDPHTPYDPHCASLVLAYTLSSHLVAKHPPAHHVYTIPIWGGPLR